MKMKKFSIIISVFMSVMLWSCAEADQEFVHDSNIITQMICRASHGSSEFRGEIFEFDKNGDELPGGFTQEQAEGGVGLIIFKVSKNLAEDVNLSNIYLIATLTWDQFITPSLSGRHDITGEGIIITVRSGVGTTRQYRVRGEYV
jgi:hypothetical protein